VTHFPSFSARFDQALATAPADKPFLVIDGKPTTYRELAQTLGRLYALFALKGLRAGDRIGVTSADPRTVCIVLLAALRAGLAVVNLNPALKPQERLAALGACDLRHLFIDRDLASQQPLQLGFGVTKIDAAARPTGTGILGRLLPQRRATGASDGLTTELAGCDVAPTPEAIPPENIGLMLFTSGTTSAPKVVQLSQANLEAQLATFDTVYDYDRESRILNPLPLHFTDGILHGPLSALMNGATLYRPTVFEFQQIGELLEGIYRDRITHFIVVPALLSFLDRLHDRYRDAFATPDFRYIRSSGDALPAKLWRSVEERFKVRVTNTYGLSETVCEALYCGPAPERYRRGTIGRPVDCEIRLVGEDGRVLAPGETGELQIRGANIMVGYLNRADLTADVVDPDGWFRTGDLASIDDDGFVHVVGRKKAIIITGGVNVQPQDVVEAMLAHPAVAEAFAFGIPDQLWGEIVACAVVPRSADMRPSSDELSEHCRRHLAPTKVPRVVLQVDALPRNPAGKVLVDELRRIVAGQSAKGFGNAETIHDRVIDIAARTFKCSPDGLHPASEPRTTMGWDSFAHLAFVSELEGSFGVDLNAHDVLRITTLGAAVDVIEQRLADGAA
jgi:long-chain acyl-CoA synthetase